MITNRKRAENLALRAFDQFKAAPRADWTVTAPPVARTIEAALDEAEQRGTARAELCEHGQWGKREDGVVTCRKCGAGFADIDLDEKDAEIERLSNLLERWVPKDGDARP